MTADVYKALLAVIESGNGRPIAQLMLKRAHAGDLDAGRWLLLMAKRDPGKVAGAWLIRQMR